MSLLEGQAMWLALCSTPVMQEECLSWSRAPVTGMDQWYTGKPKECMTGVGNLFTGAVELVSPNYTLMVSMRVCDYISRDNVCMYSYVAFFGISHNST